MPARLIITRKGDPNWRHEREFGQEVITIGRDSSNTLWLDDPKKIVSRHHARLHLENGVYFLTDCGSHNYTYLNQRRISRNIPHRLNPGDRFQIGEYILEFFPVEERPREDATVVLVNPFEEEVKILAGLLKRIQRKFNEEAPDEATAKLRFALLTMTDEFPRGDICQIIASVLQDEKQAPAQAASEPVGGAPPTPMEEDKEPGEAAVESGPAASEEGAVSPESWELFAGAVIGLAKEHARFVREFVGMESRSGKEFLEGFTPGQLQDYLHHTDLSPEEREERRQDIRKQLDELLDQYRRVLDLYRVRITDALEPLIEALDPETIRRELEQEGFRMGPLKLPAKWFSTHLQRKVHQILQERLAELRDPERPILEKEALRPLLLPALNSNGTSPEPSNGESA